MKKVIRLPIENKGSVGIYIWTVPYKINFQNQIEAKCLNGIYVVYAEIQVWITS